MPQLLRVKTKRRHYPGMKSVSPFGRPLTMQQTRRFFRERYARLAAPAVLMLVVSLASSAPSSAVLAWMSGVLLGAMTLNRFLP